MMTPDKNDIHTKQACTVSRRNALKLGGALLGSAVLPPWHTRISRSTVTVGNPSQPFTLPADIINAYAKGARDITIAPGNYVLPATGTNSIELTAWNNAILRCKDVTIIFKETFHRPILLSRCTLVAIEDATLQFAGISYTQGRIREIGEDAKGSYIEWQIDTGYPTDINPSRVTYNVIDQHTRLFKVGTGDSQAKEAMAVSSGVYRLYRITGMMAPAAVNDWLICRAKGGSSIIQLDQSKSCTMRRITLKNAGFAAFFETGGVGGHSYFDCRVSRGAKPAGATEEQLVACGADGFHSTGTQLGPTIEHCIWDGVLLDDCIAIHGSFQTVIRSEGNTLILEKGYRAGFTIGEPVRISSSDGFFAQAKCIAMRTLSASNGCLELTLDKVVSAPANSKAGNPDRCGKSYRIIDCILGNTRSRGILVKADNGLIRGCTIDGCGMSAVSIGPEYYWNEANYSWNVTVSGNTFRHNALRNNRRADGVIFVHGDGAIGNRNIKLANNVFNDNYGPYMMSISWVDGVKIIDNIIKMPSPLLLSDPGYIISLHDARNIMLKGNTYRRPGPSIVRAVEIGKYIGGVTGDDHSGIRLFES